MTPQELKNSILQLAIQGKLVEQRPEEGTAGELLATVVIGNLVDGQRVKQKTIVDITEDDFAFEIPKSWEWVKLGSICIIARGGSPRPIKDYITTEPNGVNWIKIGDTEKNGKYINSTAEKIKPSGVSKSRMVHAGDFLLTNSMSFGRPYILKIDGCIHDGWLVISQSAEFFYQDYLYWMLSSGYAYSQFCGRVSGAVVKNLNSDKVANSVFPLPPLAEQKRIVAKIEELLPLVDRYEKAWNQLKELDKRFPEDMQKALLQWAIQGKLVEQCPEEGTGEELYQQIQAEKQALIKSGKIKKEKPLPEITEDEVPFEIPESWQWVRLGNVITLLSGTDFKPDEYNDHNRGIPYITGASCLSATGVLVNRWTEMPRVIAKRGDVLLVCKGSGYGKAVICNIDEAHIARQIMVIKHSSQLDMNYIIAFVKANLQSIKANGQGVIPGIDRGSVLNMIFPLPPLAEQKRIVARLEEFLPLCERLK